MALVKYNNNSISAVTAAASIPSGSMNLLNTNTITSGVASSSFTSNIDSTYDTYMFKFINMHPATDNAHLQFNMSTDGGSNYNVTKTTTVFDVAHKENGADGRITYDDSCDLAQSTAYQQFGNNLGIGGGNDESLSGEMYLFSPSSTTFVKHFLSRTQMYGHADYSFGVYIGGYVNDTSAINAIDFKMHSGNIDSGIIKMYGLSKS